MKNPITLFKKSFIFSAFLLLLSACTFAQENAGKDIKELQNIYDNLEYNTTVYNDVKKKWLISDPLIVREAFNRFVVRNAFRKNGKPVSMETIQQRSQDIFEGKLYIDVRQRYYDTQLEYFAFLHENQLEEEKPEYFFDPVTDGFYLEEIIGELLYKKIVSQSYYFSNLTQVNHNTREGYYYDVNLNFLDPELMLWSATTQERNKYAFSMFGKWGNDRIFIPGWFLSEYFAGIKLTYYDLVGANRDEYTYSINLAYGVSAGQPYDYNIPQKPLYKSGKSFYLKLSGDLLQLLTNNSRDLYFDIEGMFTTSGYEKPDYGVYSEPVDFFAVRDYYSVHAKLKNIFEVPELGMFEAGAGLSSHSIYNFQLNQAKVFDKAPKKWIDRFDHFASVEFGVNKPGGLIQHNINFLSGYNLQREYLYLGVAAKFMLNNTFGLDIRYVNSLGLKQNEQPWRNNYYLVFSPIIRINY
jgi:hypothetical protein